MHASTRDKLLDLNRRFYETVAEEFNQTRQSPWKGWDLLLPFFSALPSPFSVLDLGCGNGRFETFLQSRGRTHTYTGVDQSTHLLNKARKNFPEATFINQDLLSCSGEADVVVLFGVLHHIPSFDLRRQLLEKVLARQLLVVSCWQLTDKRVPWEKVGLSQEDVDEHDYLLPWAKRDDVYRYCHLTTEAEMYELMKGLPYTLVDSFYADGRNDKLNRYYVYQSMGSSPFSMR